MCSKSKCILMENGKAGLVQAVRESETPLVTLSFFRFSGLAKVWAFMQMGRGRLLLRNIPGLKFWKLLGTGHGLGFSIKPNFAEYGLLGVWQTLSHADHFLEDSRFIKQYTGQTDAISTIKLIPVKAQGLWSGQAPFSPVLEPAPDVTSEPVAILTRASIRLGALRRFWRYVPLTSRELAQAPGLRFSIGIGEAPLIHQATFSIWENETAMQDFAYHSPYHREVIKKTRAENWYKEELFARFRVLENFDH